MHFNLRYWPAPGRPRCSVLVVEACVDGVLEVFSLTLYICASWHISYVFGVELGSIQRGGEKRKSIVNNTITEGGFELRGNIFYHENSLSLNASVGADWIKLTFCVWYSFGSKSPLHQHTDQTHNRPYPSDRPVKPAEWTWGNLTKHVIHLIWQHKRPQQVIHAQRHSGGSKHRCVDDGEQFLPLKCEDSSDNAGSHHGAERCPHWSKAVKLSDNHQDGEGEQAPQLQAAEEESHSGHQHGHQPAEHTHTQGDPGLCLCPQLGVQHWLLMVQKEYGCWAEYEAREEHHHLEAAVSLKGNKNKVRLKFYSCFDWEFQNSWCKKCSQTNSC